jgi:hypothetical protein
MKTYAQQALVAVLTLSLTFLNLTWPVSTKAQLGSPGKLTDLKVGPLPNQNVARALGLSGVTPVPLPCSSCPAGRLPGPSYRAPSSAQRVAAQRVSSNTYRAPSLPRTLPAQRFAPVTSRELSSSQRLLVRRSASSAYLPQSCCTDQDYYYSEEVKLINETGENGNDRPGRASDSDVNLGSKNFSFSLPVLSLPGRAGLGLNLALSYNSKSVWTKSPANNRVFFNQDSSFPAPGWRSGFGTVHGIWTSTSIDPYTNSTTLQQHFVYIEPDGTRHDLVKVSGTNEYESYDSSYLRWDNTNKVLKFPNGSKIYFERPLDYQGNTAAPYYMPIKVQDRNGNQITITNSPITSYERKIDYVEDTLKRKIDFEYTNGLLTAIRQNRGTDASPNWVNFVTITWDVVPVETNFASPLTTDPYMNDAEVYVPIRVTYQNGVNYRLFYTSYAQVYLMEKWVPAAGQDPERRVAYTKYNLPSYFATGVPDHPDNPDPINQDTSALSDAPGFTTRKEWAENWNNNAEATYSYYFTSNYSKITDPLGRITRTEFFTSEPNNGLVQYQKLFANAADESGNAPKRTTTFTYESDNRTTYYANHRVTRVDVTDHTVTPNVTRRVDTVYSTSVYSGFAVVDYVDEYDSDGATVYRRAKTTYNTSADYTSRWIHGLPATIEVYSGPGTTLLAKTAYTYDEGNPYFIDSTGDGVVQWDNTGGSSPTGRANLTTVTQHKIEGGASVGTRNVMRTTYDSQGSVRKVTDAAGHATEFDIWDNYSNKPAGIGETHALPKAIKDPDGFWNGARYNYFHSQPVETYHLNGSTEENKVTYAYDSSDRLIARYRPDGGWTTYNHWDNWQVFATYDKIDGDETNYRTNYNFVVYDGAGRVRSRGGDHPDGISGKYWGQKFVIDAVGRTSENSNVTGMNGSWQADSDETGWWYTEQLFDTFDRTIEIQRTDHDDAAPVKQTFAYTGCGCAGTTEVEQTDERGLKKKQIYDHFGRLAEAREINFSDGSTYSKAVYTYSRLNQLLSLKHYNAGSAFNERTFQYDGYGRQKQEVTPEGGQADFDWTDDDLLNWREDQRIVSGSTKYRTSFGYNGRHLITSIRYNDNDVTPDVYFTYGDYGERTKMEEKNDALTVLAKTDYAYDSYKRLQVEQRTFNGLSGVYKLTYTYNLIDQITRIKYDVGAWSKNVNYAYAFSRAVSSIGTNMIGTDPDATANVLDTARYRGFGAPKSFNHGANLRKTEMSYDAKRQHITSLQVKKQDNSGVILDLAYSLTGGSGGANSNNNDRLRRVTDNLNGAWTVNYTYDNYNRLITAAAGSTYNRNYSYDAWGNLTQVANNAGDAYAGEAPNYTLTLTQNGSGAPATNRIASVGSETWSYDTAGNPDSIGGVSYTYDAANRLTQIGSSANSYGYDGEGRRDKVRQGGYDPLYLLWSSLLDQPLVEIGPDGSVFRAFVSTRGNQPVAGLSHDGNFYWVHADHLSI